MSMDQDDAPKGEIAALTMITIVTLIIIVATFDSCAEFAYSEEYQLCGDVEMEIQPPVGEDDACFDEDGVLHFRYRNDGDEPFEGVHIAYEDMRMNLTEYVPRMSMGLAELDLDLQIGQMYNPANVSPIVYFDEVDDYVVCDRAMQRVRNLIRC